MKKTILMIVFMATLLVACGNKPTTTTDLSSTEISAKTNENHQETTFESETDIDSKGNVDAVKEKLEIKPFKTLDGEVCLLITNNSDSIVDELEVQIIYRDASGKTIDMVTDGHDMLIPGNTVVSKMSAPEEYSDYEIISDIQLDCHPSYKNHADKVSVSSNPGEGCVIVEITNNDDVPIDEIEYNVVFYKGDNVAHVNYPQDITNVDAGKTVTEKVSIYGFEYDKHEVYLNQAHTFG